MQFKKFLSITVAMLMLLSCLLLAVACGDETSTEGPTAAPTEETTTEAPTSAPTEAPSDDEPADTTVEYTVTVLDGDGAPVVGASVQICKDESCLIPVKTNDKGVAVFKIDEYETYKARVLKAAGYVFGEDYTYFEAGEFELTLVIEKESAGSDEPAEPAECEHTWVDATCDAPKTCSKCNETEGEKLKHVLVKLEAVAPTCTEDGLTEGEKCSLCGKITIRQGKLYTSGHSYVDTAAVAPTCTDIGVTEGRSCKNCGDVVLAVTDVPATGHKLVATGEPVAPTCLADGISAGEKCTVCDYEVAPGVIPATGHTFGEATKREPTCTTDGYESIQTCSVCSEQVLGEKLSKLGHDYDDMFDAICSRCDDDRSVTISKSAFVKFGVGRELVTYYNFRGVKFLGASLQNVDPTTFEVTFGSAIKGVTISAIGYADIGESIDNFGYCIDGDWDSFVESPSGRDTDIIPTEGVSNRTRTFDVKVATDDLTVGEHTIKFALVKNGFAVELCTWTINIDPKPSEDTSKPTANVIIISGQSNAYGASPLTDAIKEQYADSDYSNIYIKYNNINLSGNWQTLFGNDAFEQYKLGIGAEGATRIGPEFGVAEYLASNGYTEDEEWYIIKYTAAGTMLNGQWYPTTHTSDPNFVNQMEALRTDLGDYLSNLIYDYIVDALGEISDTHNIKIQSFMWMQGESDAGASILANQYQRLEKQLIDSIRSDFNIYADDGGISFVSGGISEVEGVWPEPEMVNEAKKENAAWHLDPDAEEGLRWTENTDAKVENSFFIDTTTLISKAVAGEQASDPYHYSSISMVKLGTWFAECMFKGEELQAAANP